MAGRHTVKSMRQLKCFVFFQKAWRDECWFWPSFSFSFVFLPFLGKCTSVECSISEFWLHIIYITHNSGNSEHFHQHRMFLFILGHSPLRNNKFYLFLKSLRILYNEFLIIFIISYLSPDSQFLHGIPTSHTQICVLSTNRQAGRQTEKHQSNFFLPMY